MDNELEQYIKSYFGIVDAEDMNKIVSLFKPNALKKGEYFLKAGKQSNKLSFIKSGYIRVYLNTEHKEVTQWIGTKGFFITDLSSLVFDTPARFNMQAIVDSQLYTLSKEDYNKIGSLIPKWDTLEKLFLARCFIFMEDRILSHLTMTSEERYQWFFENNREMFNHVPLQYIASMLGMTPETFSRIRAKQGT